MASSDGRDRRPSGDAFLGLGGGGSPNAAKLLHRVVDVLVDAAASAGDRTPFEAPPDVDVEDPILDEPPLSSEEIVERIGTICSGSANLGHPGALAHMDPPPATASVVGDLVASALNDNLLFRELSPLFTRMERRLLSELARTFGLGREGGGLMLPGGSLANLQALVLARNAASARGRGDRGRPFVVVASDAAHASVRKAAMVMGLGKNGVRTIPTATDGRLESSGLASALGAVAQEGLSACVVATAGTTVTGAIDPLSDMAEIARAHRAWFHVDAAFGGALVFSPAHRSSLDGIERADSVTFNPQKVLCVARTAAMVLLRRESDLLRHFRVDTPYAGGERVERGELSLQGSSRPDVLKLWLTLRHLGPEGRAALVDRGLAEALEVAARLRSRPRIEIAAPPQTPLLCFRDRPPRSVGHSVDRWNLDLRAHLCENFGIVLSTPLWKGSRWLRLVTINPLSHEDLASRLAMGVESFSSRRGRHHGRGARS